MKYFLAFLLVSKLISACQLIGNVSGNCVNSNDIKQNVDLCSPYLADYVCVPFNNVGYH